MTCTYLKTESTPVKILSPTANILLQTDDNSFQKNFLFVVEQNHKGMTPLLYKEKGYSI